MSDINYLQSSSTHRDDAVQDSTISNREGFEDQHPKVGKQHQETERNPSIHQQVLPKTTSSIHHFEDSDLIILEQIREGDYGVMHRAEFKKAYKGYTEVAVKSINSMTPDYIEMLSRLAHPNIVKMLGICQFDVIDVVVLELASRGSLYDYLRKDEVPIPEKLVRKWLRESAQGIQYLHENNVIHMDIKSNNCLLFQDDTVKLDGFSLAANLNDSYQRTSSKSRTKSTWQNLAPEILKSNETKVSSYTEDTDVFSYGMLIFEICTRHSPYEWVTIPATCPKDLSDLMQLCWETNPEERPTIDRILKGEQFNIN